MDDPHIGYFNKDREMFQKMFEGIMMTIIDTEGDNMSRLKDSGARKVFETGAVRDISEGKGRCDLLPLDMVIYILEEEVGVQPVLRCVDNFLRTGDPDHLRKSIIRFCDGIQQSLPSMFLELSIHYEDGAEKYEPNNWKKGMPVHSFIDSGIRHYLKWLNGDEDEPHHRAFLWNMVGAMWIIENKPELNDINPKDYFPIAE